MSPARLTGALLLLPALTLLAGCPKKRNKDADDDDGTDTVQSIDAALNLSSIDPSTVPAGKPFDATLYGSGFQPGATVFLGSDQASSVTFASARTLDLRGPALQAGRYDVEVVLPNGQRSRLVQGLRVDDLSTDCREVVVYFDLDQDSLRSDSVSVLNENLNCLRQASTTVTIEGHTDERGTTEYNLALGQRRAASVRDWLARNGLSTSRLRTVTFGEERPVDPSHDEGAWARNRRAVVLLGR